MKERPPNPEKFILVPGDLQEVSSTEIRKRLKNNGDLYELMVPEAADYLKTLKFAQ